MTDKPLAEPDFNSLLELTKRDPLSLTEEDLTTLVTGYRAAREAYAAGQKPKRKGKKTMPSADAIMKEVQE